MSSEKKIGANRRNARSSTGPRTAAGKRRSSQNAVTHGALSHSPVLPGESEPERECFVETVAGSLQPIGGAETVLAHQVGQYWWRLQRMGKIESGFFQKARAAAELRAVAGEVDALKQSARETKMYKELYGDRAPLEKVLASEGVRQARAGQLDEWLRVNSRAQAIEAGAAAQSDVLLAQSYQEIEDDLAKLSRYETTLARQALVALQALMALQRKRKTDEELPEATGSAVLEGQAAPAALDIRPPQRPALETENR